MAFQPEEEAAPQDLNDDAVTEILLRLPSAAVLRSRAVCRAWRRIATSSPAFAAAHARRRPLELIFQRRGPSGALESIPAAALDEPQRWCLDVEYPKESFWRGYYLIASCNGLLLFQRGRGGCSYYVCNPVTRQWTSVLPCPAGTFTLPCGFYVHGPSGEHRLLCLTSDHQGSHYVYSLEAAEARRLGQALPVMRLWLDQPICSLSHRGKLHWLRHPRVIVSTENDNDVMAGDDGDKYKILAFDTVSETFRRISRPPLRRRDGVAFFFLLEMDGMLAMADFLDGSMHLSVLEDYNDDKSWTRRLQVHLPAPLQHTSWAVNADVEEAGQGVILLGDNTTCWVGLYHVKQKRVLKKFLLADNERRGGRNPPTVVHALLFRDSLERHNFFHLDHSPQ